MIEIDGNSLSIEQIEAVARGGEKVRVSPAATERITGARQTVAHLLRQGEIVYGITTGFGKFSDVNISPEETRQLQRNLIRSHATGVGEALPEEVARAVMLLRANALAKGYSGVRTEVVETLVAMLNAGVHPVIPAQGSVGASGDLAPLAHMTLPLIGEGEALYRGRRLDGAEAMRQAGIQPLTLEAKEGLALINGTPVMTAIGALAVYDTETLLEGADVAAAMSVEALRGISDAFDPRVHEVRPHPGQMISARKVRGFLANSELVSRGGEFRIHDAYSLRCIPQVHGAARDAASYVRRVVETEINSATDNPLVFPGDGVALSAGNFHGQPVALAMDFLGMAVSELANISQCRISRLLTGELEGLPIFLVPNGGLNSGFMLSQYTAAALVSENKVLASPASVDSIPTSAYQEDHVSMGTIAARKARKILENVQNVLAIEFLCAAQALDFHMPCRLGDGTGAAYRLIRTHVRPLTDDRPLYRDIEVVRKLLVTRQVQMAVSEKVVSSEGQ